MVKTERFLLQITTLNTALDDFISFPPPKKMFVDCFIFSQKKEKRETEFLLPLLFFYWVASSCILSLFYASLLGQVMMKLHS